MTAAWRHRLILGSPFIAAIVLFAVTPSDDGPTFCPFALCTGMACPGCGMTRAMSHLVKGEIGTALSYHPLVPVAAVGAIGAWGWFALRLTGTVRPLSQLRLNIILIGAAAALLAVWGVRLVMGTLPPV